MATTVVSLLLRSEGFDQASRGFANIKTQAASLGRGIASGLDNGTRALSRFHEALNGFSSITALTGGVLGLAGLQQFTSGVIQLERAMLSVKANIMSGAGSAAELNAQLKAVDKTADSISRNTMFTKAQSVLTQNALLKSGIERRDVDGDDGMAMSVASLAKIGGADPETLAARFGTIYNTFGLDKKGGKDTADHMARVDDASGFTGGLDMMLTNAQQVSSTTKTLGYSAQDMFSAIGYLDSLGESAGTSLNRFYSGLTGATPQRQKEIKRLGLDFWEKGADGKTHVKDQATVFRLVRDKFGNIQDDSKRLKAAQIIFGEEGGRAANVIAGRKESFDEFEKKIAGASSLQDKLAVSTSGLGDAFDRLKSSVFSAAESSSLTKSARDGAKGVLNLAEEGVKEGYGGEMAMGAVGAAIAARLAYKAWRGRGDKGGPKGGGLPDLIGGAGLQRVFVTNWPGGLLSSSESLRQQRDNSGGGAGAEGAADTTKKGGKPGARQRVKDLVGGFKSTLKYGAPLAMLYGAYEAYNTYSDDSLSQAQKNKEYKRTAYSTGGSIIGGTIGGSLGALFGGLGAVPGAWIGSSIGSTIGEWLAKDDAKNNATDQQMLQQGQDQVQALRRIEVAQQQTAQALSAVAQRPTEVHLDGNVLATSVNSTNATAAKRN